MGGKKKTKWRKLPLDELTKVIPSKPEKEETYEADLNKNDNDYIPSYTETAENNQNYGEPYEYIDGIWYPSPCVVYNPADVGLYSNYVMPLDTNYYYYTVPQMQEYVPVPYPEYTSQLTKDAVYLLLPSQTFRPLQPVQSVAPEWQNRRRRRRYEGYADYAVIPEKTFSRKTEEKDRGKRTEQNVNSDWNNIQTYDFRRMTSFSEVNQFNDSNSIPAQNQSRRARNEEEKNVIPPINIRNKKDFIKNGNNTENPQRRKKSLEMCGIHKKDSVDEKGPQTIKACVDLSDDFYPQTDLSTTSIENKHNPKVYSDELKGYSNSSKGCDLGSNLTSISPLESETGEKFMEISLESNDIKLSSKQIDEQIPSLQNPNHEVNRNTKSILNLENISQFSEETELFNNSTKDAPKTKSKYVLPDILRATTAETTKDPDLSTSHLDCTKSDKGRSPQSKSFLTQSSCIANVLHSDSLQNEMELELKKLESLISLQTYQNVYKLAYDENVTDQSENDSRSPSPVEPESQVPASLTSAEILIHEADSGSDAGSEDVELLPHRYESETFLSENKHVYINKLSLAVELLRTQESLPYDDEFKRVGENILPGIHTGGKINQGFVGDSGSPKASSMTNYFETNSASCNKNEKEVVSSCQLKRSANSSSDSAIFSDIGSDNLEDELCEAAREAINQSSEIQNCTEEVRAGYRRFGVQPQHFFSPRAALSLNPCFCCIIM